MDFEEMEKRMEFVKEPDCVYHIVNIKSLIAGAGVLYAIYCWIVEKQHISWLTTWAIVICLTVAFLYRRNFHGPNYQKELLTQTAVFSFGTLIMALVDPVATYNALSF